MKTLLFKNPEEELTPAEEEKILHELAEAYQENENQDSKPEVTRILRKVEEQLSKEMHA